DAHDGQCGIDVTQGFTDLAGNPGRIASSAHGDAHLEEVADVLAVGLVMHHAALIARGDVLGVGDDSDDLIFIANRVAAEANTFADGSFPGKEIAYQRLIDNYHARGFFIVVVIKVATGEEVHAECLKVAWQNDVDLRGRWLAGCWSVALRFDIRPDERAA